MSQKQKKQNKEAARTSVIVAFTDDAWDDYKHWTASDSAVSACIDDLIGEIMRTPFTGTGKPEALKGDLTGYWSRRINREHRLVYFYEGGLLTVITCRFHY
ncbi:Txe/YoeB family addiction module toxin [Pseudomonas syringae]|uniref:Putative mRNA interferase YoeB n=1 Tax=Pseudomonas syringae pv. actinidiae TaxID=103796 RepID=A0A286JZR5_PSESF|nr:Txe/YoeB family addiction module toxin [Pseudomonas syringae]PHX44379.1 toxin YoeB [Pseudomonas sp. NZIPFR-PS5]AMW88289.1 YoeB toxin protein [Pseudomonas syringae pv. actinidiae]OKS58558.1 toxin YoeB [Pseudomonas syringae pv. actinidiae]OKS79633.1 toxin YoeB [Pseudomonas syringae pv. actinidiae]OSO70467.1 Toxin RelK [Pseudomonas syringae pv. actinidiae]